MNTIEEEIAALREADGIDPVVAGIIAHSINLMRLEAATRAAAVALLDEMALDILGQLAARNLTSYTRAALTSLLAHQAATLSEWYARLDDDMQHTNRGVAQLEARFISDTLRVQFGRGHLPTETHLTALVSDLLIQGAPSSAYWQRQGQDTAFRFAAAVRQGVAQGETNGQIINRVVDSELVKSKRGAAALVQSSVQTVANNARLATFRANRDIIRGVRQISTLDNKTTDVCIAYDGAAWDLDGEPIDGNDLPFNSGPPRHWNCRSVLVPITKTYRELGLNVPEIADSTRASIDGQQQSGVTFTQFLKGKSESFQDDLLGPGRAAMWRDGKITLRDLLDQTGRPLTLAELRKKYGH